ncbi:MAG TPA: hypothetical protein VFB62_00120 [Polyangiaceae bacterium]|nr:hypothetical protein [Polyangiaceae bacterium]
MTSDGAARYARQILLAELGSEGQARICAATAHVAGTTPAHAIATRYAERAGFAEVAPGELDLDTLAPESLVKHPAARAVLAGARAALAEMRKARHG